MDLLMPNIGEVIGGSVREERLDVLENTLKKYLLKFDLKMITHSLSQLRNG